MERYGLGLELSFFFFFTPNSSPLTRDVTSSVTVLEPKIYEEAMSDEHTPINYL